MRDGMGWLVCGVLAAALSLAQPAFAEVKIGVAGAIHNSVEGVVGGAAAPLRQGSSLVSEQMVRTGEQSTAQLLFLDETSLNIGPQSEIVLDRFVYDPARSQNDIALSAAKGIFRFVSGSSDPRSYRMRTPVATIGVRGTIYDAVVGLDATYVILVEGRLIVTGPDGREYELDRPGQFLAFHKSGRVEGPKTWDGTLIRVTGVAAYPLYGSTFMADPRDPIAPDTRDQNVDEINTRDLFEDFEENPCPTIGGPFC